MLKLGTDSVRHTDTITKVITQLGGSPNWDFSPFPEDHDVLRIFQIQLRKETHALELHQNAAMLMPLGEPAEMFAAIANEEEKHIELVNRIIQNLASS